jgi:hypothetical protein
VALADGIHGFVDFEYSNFDSETEGIAGDTTETESHGFVQTYYLNFDKRIFPNLRLNGGGTFEKDISTSETGDTDSESSRTVLRPFIDLRLNSPLYTAGVGYNRRQEKVKIEGLPSLTEINEDYHALLGWRPQDFPSLEMRFEKTNTFDDERVFEDITRDRLSLTAGYTYVKGLDLRYVGTYREENDRLNNLEIEEFIHDGRGSYSRRFLYDRITMYTDYHITRRETETSTVAGGEVSFQLFPFAGLSAIDDTPTEGALNPNPALIDGNLTASSGINIGLPPPGGETRPRNMGLDFLNETEVNILSVWVDRELPSEISNSFSWDIYTSPDNQNWSFLQTVAPAPFGPFVTRFELRFSNVVTRYIKVVTGPLAPAVPGAQSFPDIFVTEIQAFVRRPAEEVRGKSTRTSQVYDLNVRARLLNTPSLHYDFSYFFNRVDPPSLESSTFSNGFSLSHRFSRFFSGTARVVREDIDEEREDTVTYRLSGSITAVPLETLTHSIVYSGSFEEIDEESVDRNSVFLYNRAELYKGIDVNLSGGLSFEEGVTGRRTQDTTFNFIATLVPHTSLTVTVNYSGTWTELSGGGSPKSSTSEKTGDVSVSWTPLRTLFLSASLGILDEDDRTRTTQNYGLNWSPFPDGTLQFSLDYNESLTTEPDGEARVIVPRVRWNINKNTFLDISYQRIWSDSDSGKTDSGIFSTNLRISF